MTRQTPSLQHLLCQLAMVQLALHVVACRSTGRRAGGLQTGELPLTTQHPSKRAPPPHLWFGRHVASLGSSEAKRAGESGRVFNVVDFGADPTGIRDSTKPIAAALAAAENATDPGTRFVGNVSSHGGVTVDLAGGVYMLSAGVHIQHGGVRLCCGALIADNVTFASWDFLISVSGGVVEDTTLEDLLLDARQRGGGVYTDNALRVHISRVCVAEAQPVTAMPT